MLDLCLQQLEDAQERGDCVLSADLAAGIGGIVGPLLPGMSTVDAMEMIFNEQERYLADRRDSIAGRGGAAVDADADHGRGSELRRHPAPHAGLLALDMGGSEMIDAWKDGVIAALATTDALPSGTGSGPMSEAEARQLTERIRTATRYVCLLLREVHERRAWVPLGYTNWEQYVQTEFSISRSRSYELLDQANVILDLRSAAGMRELPNVSAYVALQIKPRLPMIKEAVRQRVREANGEKAVDIVAEIVDEHRRQVVQSRRLVQEQRARRHPSDDPDCRDQFTEVIAALASMASARRVEEVVNTVEPPQIASVVSAIQWLNDVLRELQRKYDGR